MKLVDIFNVCSASGIAGLPVHISEYAEDGAVKTVEIMNYDDATGEHVSDEDLADHVEYQAECEELSESAYQARYISKVLLLS